MDQPSIDGINAFFISKAAAEIGVKVALSGVGGDELFSGYPSFLDVPRWVGSSRLAASVPGLGRLTRAALSHLVPREISPKIAGMLEYGGNFPGAYLLRGDVADVEVPATLQATIGARIDRLGVTAKHTRADLDEALNILQDTLVPAALQNA